MSKETGSQETGSGVTRVWSTGSESPDTGGARPGDVVVRMVDGGSSLAIGTVAAGSPGSPGSVVWMAETVPVSALPAGAVDGLLGGDGLSAAPDQSSLLTAAQGLEWALVERGG